MIETSCRSKDLSLMDAVVVRSLPPPSLKSSVGKRPAFALSNSFSLALRLEIAAKTSGLVRMAFSIACVSVSAEAVRLLKHIQRNRMVARYLGGNLAHRNILLE